MTWRHSSPSKTFSATARGREHPRGPEINPRLRESRSCATARGRTHSRSCARSARRRASRRWRRCRWRRWKQSSARAARCRSPCCSMPTCVTRCRRSTLAPASRSEARRCWWPRRSPRYSAPSSASRRSSTSLRRPSCALASPPPPPRRCCCSSGGRTRFPPPWAASARSSCSARGACLRAVSGSCAPRSALRGARCCSPSVRGAPRMRARPRTRCSRSGETSTLSCLGRSSRTGPSARR